MNVLEWFSLQFPYKSEVKLFKKSENTSNYPCHIRPPVPENPS